MFPNIVDMQIYDLTIISWNLINLSSFGTLFLDHSVSQLFVMPQLTTYNSLLNIILKVIDME